LNKDIIEEADLEHPFYHQVISEKKFTNQNILMKSMKSNQYRPNLSKNNLQKKTKVKGSLKNIDR
jgi:hypothetical protein